MKVTTQGAPVPNQAYEYFRGRWVRLVEIDMQSKYCEVMATGGGPNGPSVFLIAGTDSLHLDETKPRDAYTAIEFPEYKGWDIWTAEISRYSLRLVLTKDRL